MSTGNELLADIQQVSEIKQVDKIRTTELIDAQVDDDELSWVTCSRVNSVPQQPALEQSRRVPEPATGTSRGAQAAPGK